MSSFTLIVTAILVVAFFTIVRVLSRPPLNDQTLAELESEIIAIDAEFALALQSSHEGSGSLEQPQQSLV